MKCYKIKPEYLSLWGEDATGETIVTGDTVLDLAREWDKPLDELMDQLIEADDDTATADAYYTYGEWCGLSVYMRDGVLAFWEDGYDYSDPNFWDSYEDTDHEFIRAVRMFDYLYKHNMIDHCGDKI